MRSLRILANLRACLGLLALVLTWGCRSEAVTLVATPKAEATVVGVVEGTSAGMLAIGYSPFQFIPIGLNERMQHAYDEALAKAPGATGLRKVTLQESWYWVVVGTLRYVTITGEAVR